MEGIKNVHGSREMARWQDGKVGSQVGRLSPVDGLHLNVNWN